LGKNRTFAAGANENVVDNIADIRRGNMPEDWTFAGMGRPRDRPMFLYFNGFKNCERIFEFNAEVSNGAVHFGVTE
jgi:hypothetical protein